MKNGIILGIDTSNYTTSVALMTTEGELVANIKRPLTVRAGERGLRQSDALFLHTKNMPSAMNEAKEMLAGRRIAAIGVSSRPRNTEGSYMPCFLAGVAAAESAACASGASVYQFSHQCGHIMAALYSARRTDLLSGSFAAFHVSGGTTELLAVKPSGNAFSAELVGGTKDLNAGQVIDRVGVKLGLTFPCGPALERLALANDKKIPKRKVAKDGLYVNLSGIENLADKIYRDTGSAELTAAFVLDHIGDSMIYMTDSYFERYGKSHIVYAGGVMCNSIIKNRLSKLYDCSFAEPTMSCDNAVGIAYLALRAFENN